MAKAPAAPSFDPETLYEVTIKRPITIGRLTLLPSQTNRVKGKLLEDVKDDIIDAKEL